MQIINRLFRALWIGVFLMLFACKKDEIKPDCETNKYGTVTVSNSSSNPYKLYIDDVYYGQLSGGSITQNIKLNEGNNRKLYVLQVSGYLLYPTERTTYFNVISCSSYTWQIP
jgi:hypothetical protein